MTKRKTCPLQTQVLLLELRHHQLPHRVILIQLVLVISASTTPQYSRTSKCSTLVDISLSSSASSQ